MHVGPTLDNFSEYRYVNSKCCNQMRKYSVTKSVNIYMYLHILLLFVDIHIVCYNWYPL